ncbi:hypothetical protein LTSEWAN_0223 [Salmonella enterica subsp. enterica serovar Wandsworth str. A4-580]|uniref:Uncharacterized protein n=1 Tax=Salmonella enterica subsp. enterica serovar Wandsworth str. A4-580 TaxID=913086 RepID=G5S656_SALET|nr:hypothetical protein LTSEWAN_0223 [Salmonella enterica subsp. enterica serovar Wandsworth str. A4-580]
MPEDIYYLFRLFLDDDDGTASQRDLCGGFCGHAGGERASKRRVMLRDKRHFAWY